MSRFMCVMVHSARPDVAIVGEADGCQAAQVLQVLDGRVGQPRALDERQAGQLGRRLHKLALQRAAKV